MKLVQLGGYGSGGGGGASLLEATQAEVSTFIGSRNGRRLYVNPSATVNIDGTEAADRAKLQAGATGDWTDSNYVGATSGATTTSKAYQVFNGTDAISAITYRYECLADNIWKRIPRRPQFNILTQPGGGLAGRSQSNPGAGFFEFYPEGGCRNNAWAGGFFNANPFFLAAWFTNGYILSCECTVTGVQVSGTLGATGFCYVFRRSFRISGGLVVALGAKVDLLVQNDTGDAFGTAPNLVPNVGSIDFTMALTTAKTISFNTKIKVDVTPP